MSHAAGARLGVKTLAVTARTREDADRVFRTISGAGAVLVLSAPTFWTLRTHRT